MGYRDVLATAPCPVCGAVDSLFAEYVTHYENGDERPHGWHCDECKAGTVTPVEARIPDHFPQENEL